jgi:hypothetical protein
MNPLPTDLRNKLERTIVQARDVAEAGAKAALEALAVHHKPYGHMSPEERKLRNHLRARARQLGDKQNQKVKLEITHLVWECAYEHWHRMLFARFLAENELLIEPEMGVAISLDECEELAKEEGKDLWTLASEFAQRMLPQIFRPDDPLLKITFAREHRLKLENLLNDLEPAIFTASDSIGWVYQFWQSKRKKEVNQSGKKIGADELPAVTQLFTEPYMVSFLLDNSLGAWWAARRLTDADLQNAENEDELRKKASLPGVPLEYLRFVKLENGTWTPVAGTFEGWPEHLSELKTLDPCCGSGHFLVAAFLMLVPMRMELEGLSAREAVDAVLRENLHGLEIDSRCVELAAFALALTAWRFPDAGGYRPLPELNVACSGLSISAKKEEWLSLAGDNTNLRFALEELYKQFKDAPVLGSLINPEANLGKESLFELKWKEVGPLLTKALSGEKDDERTEIGVVALGITRAAEILAGKFDWIITNVPYLGRSKQNDTIKTFVDQNFPYALQDIGAVFLSRLANFLSNNGIFCVVSPQNWSFLKTYLGLRKKIFKKLLPIFIAELGAGAFETPLYDFSFLLTIAKASPPDKLASYTSIVTSDFKGPQEKAKFLRSRDIGVLPFKQVFEMKDMRLLSKNVNTSNPLSKFCDVFCGIQTGDNDRFVRKYWETSRKLKHWEYYQRTTDISLPYGGMEQVLFWENGKGEMSKLPGFRDRLSENLVNALNARGIGFVVHRMGKLPCTIAGAKLFDQNGAVLVPKDRNFASQIWRFITSPEYNKFVRSYDNKVGVTPATLVRPSFSPHEPDQCEESLPKPYSDDPTQWIFHGYPCGSVVWDEHTKSTTHGPLRTDDTVLQVAVARLLGYRWPVELDSAMELCDEARTLVKKSEALLSLADEDGIVCISSMRGEEPAADRLREILSVAFGQDWSPAREEELIKATGANTAAFDDWLRDHFFEQHCKLFHHRPFIWHIWDGRRRDGFHALVNYHKLAEGNGKGRQLLESLTYSYLGDWIARQKEGVKRGEGGAEDRLAATLELQKRLIAIIEGDPLFDIFVRWKPIEEQPIGWEPDINDGVRLNIRPFLAQDIPGGRKGAGILRWKPNIKWNKDRGKEPFRPREQYPWFWKDGEFTGDRVNDIHLTNEEKRRARGKDKEG